MKEFRFDIAFLRALAVIFVLFFHFKLPYFKGGFIGVDVFFVISGYLMTKIVLSGFDADNFKLLDFYNRRVKRIIPPLLVTGLGVLLLSNALYMTTDIQQNSKNVLLGALFISNVYYWMYTDYFAPEAQSNIFLHTKSTNEKVP